MIFSSVWLDSFSPQNLFTVNKGIPVEDIEADFNSFRTSNDAASMHFFKAGFYWSTVTLFKLVQVSR